MHSASYHLDAAGRGFAPSWPIIVALLALLGVTSYLPATQMLRDGDTYWHLAAGRWILEHMQVPRTDPFSHTVPGTPWTAHEWLSEVVIVQVHRWGSWPGLVAMVGLAFGAALARMNRFLLHRMEPVHALLLTVFAAVMAMPHLLARPHILAWPLLVTWVAELVEAVEGRRRPRWWLWPMMVFWANLHGSFTLGLALLAPFAAEAVVSAPRAERMSVARHWVLFAAGAVIAAMCTPSGWHAFVFTAHVMSMKFTLGAIGEWLSPNFQKLQPVQGWLFLVLILSLRGKLQLGWIRALLFLGLLHLALKHQRNVAVLGLITPLILAVALARGWYASARQGQDAESIDRVFRQLAHPMRAPGMAVWAGVMALFVLAVVQLRDVKVSGENTPQAAVDAALAARPPGPVFNAYEFGGYLIYRGVPVYVDGRADLYGDDYIKNFVRAMRLADPKAFETILAEHRIGWTIFQPGTPALAVLDKLPGWKRLHADSEAVVHVRVDGARP